MFVAIPTNAFCQPSIQNHASVYTEVYQDDDATTVIRPRVSGTWAIQDRTALSASYMVDVVSSASIDVVTRATQAISEVRHEAIVSTVHSDVHNRSYSAAYSIGYEPDFFSNAISFGIEQDLDEEKAWHLTSRLQLMTSQIGAQIDERFHRSLYGITSQVAISRIINANLIIQSTLELSHLHGFQSSPYRTIRLGQWTGESYQGSDPDAGAWVFSGVTGSALERHPDERFRSRFALDGALNLGQYASVYSLVAGYYDSWKIGSSELSTELRIEPMPNFMISAQTRVYVQSSTWFSRNRYMNIEETHGYLTGDKELSAMRSYSGVFSMMIPINEWMISLRTELTRYRYIDFDLLPDKRAFTIMLGLSWSGS